MEKEQTAGDLWKTGEGGSSLWCKKKTYGIYEWVMISPKTGKHVIKQEGPIPIMTDRVKAHWEGFQKLQKRIVMKDYNAII